MFSQRECTSCLAFALIECESSAVFFCFCFFTLQRLFLVLEIWLLWFLVPFFSESTAWQKNPKCCPSTPARPACRSTQSQSTSPSTSWLRALRMPRTKWGESSWKSSHSKIKCKISDNSEFLRNSIVCAAANLQLPSPDLSRCATTPTPRASRCWTTPSSCATWPTASTVGLILTYDTFYNLFMSWVTLLILWNKEKSIYCVTITFYFDKK